MPCDPISLIFIGGWIIYRCGKDLGPSLDTLSCLQQNPVYVLFLSNLLIPGGNSVTFIGNVLYCCLTFSFKKVVFKPYFVYGLSAEDMNNRLFISLFKPTVIVPPFSLMLQTVIYTFGRFCGESWENESRENFFFKNLEVAFASKIGNSASGRVRCKNKSHMGVILQRRGNFTMDFPGALSGDSLAPEAGRNVFKGSGELRCWERSSLRTGLCHPSRVGSVPGRCC